MALSSRSLIVYGLEVTTLNRNINFKAVLAGPTLTAIVDVGFYSPAGLAKAVGDALIIADPANTYTVSVDRTILGGLENRFTISTSGSFLSLLFGTGPDQPTEIWSLIGFNPVDYTGLTVYTGSQTVGTALIPEQIAYNYLDDENQSKVFGAVNVSAAGLKEAVTFNIQNFIDLQFKYERKINIPNWKLFFTWAIQQRPFDFTREITSPTVFKQVTLESTPMDNKGLGWKMVEMLPNYPNHYETGALKFRVIEDDAFFIAPT